MEMLLSFPSRTWHLPTLPKVPKAGSMTMVLLCLIVQQSRLTWTPENLLWETPDPTMQMTWRPLSKQPVLLLHRSSATGWLASCHAALMQQFMQKECIEMNILFRSLTFLFKRSLFYWSYVIFKFSDTLNLGFLLSVNHNHPNLNK